MDSRGGGDAVELGRAEAIVCVAADSLSRAAFRHYHARGALLPDDVATPGEDEAGRFLLGEGAGALVVEEASAAVARGAKALAQVLGSGVASGARAVSATEDVVRAALLRAGLVPGEVATVFGTAAGRVAVEAELAAVASSLEIPLEQARAMTVPAGAVLGETMGAGGALAAAAVCSGGPAGPTLVVSVDATESGSSAVAVLLGPA